MAMKPIRNDDDLRAVFRRLESVFQAAEQTPEADENKHCDFGLKIPCESLLAQAQ